MISPCLLSRPLVALPLVVLAACSEPVKKAPPPPPVVSVEAPTVQEVTVYRTFTGRTVSFETAEVHARVEGVLIESSYDERNPIEAGTVMFRIDPAPFEAARGAANAEVLANDASVRLADTTARKLEKAYETQSVSELQALEAKLSAPKPERHGSAASAHGLPEPGTGEPVQLECFIQSVSSVEPSTVPTSQSPPTDAMST